MSNPQTITALLDCRSRAVDSDVWVGEIEEMLIPIAADFAACDHGETICPSCEDSWSTDYLLMEPTPWAV